MSHKLINHSADLKKLRDQGYEVEITSGYLIVSHVPYLNCKREIKYGTLVSELTLAGDKTAKPKDHIIHFIGEYPCDKNGVEIPQIKNQCQTKTLAEGIVINYSFSNKPKNGYSDYFEKVVRYIEIISAPPRSIDHTITAQTYKVIKDKEESTVFKYIDSNSSRADIIKVTEKIKDQKIAIIGLGGSGAYVLDFIAKTPIAEIHLYDDDKFNQHNAFRSPGAASISDLEDQLLKVEYYENVYSNMHRNIITHAYKIEESNVEELLGFDFIFICIDSGIEKKRIFDVLINGSIPFVDVGMGIENNDDKLTGMLRVTASSEQKNDHVNNKIISFSDNDNDAIYKKNIQIAELNALNAAYAVIKWKKHFGFFDDQEHENHSLYVIAGNNVINEFHNT
ncbi:MAG: ThiF family adenylyltransferase [Proteobacteria bacterium]|nr:ThiF family adenylyltransferase [Pseudomonadota bacterium]NOG60323.1 ThiF family adenylyltransferase [Pseudomonadota bacterium]